MLKYATAQVMSKILIPQDAGRRELRRLAHRHHFDYEVRPGYLYVRSRAISSRCNDNFDEFPAEELARSYRSFVGKPVFVNHVNHDHNRARGVIIDAALHKDANRDGSKDWWVEVLQEVDALRFPRLAAEILKGNIARTSMGCDVAYSVCSACGNKATSPAEYCKHIPAAKGQRIYRAEASTGKKVGELIRETCYGLKFFENSLLVEPPADPTAYFTGVDARGLDKAASKHRDRFLDADAILAESPPAARTGTRKLAYGETKAPQDVDTLREDACAVCGDRDTYDGTTCQVCGYVAPPKMFQDPDLEVARSMDLRKDVAEFNGQPGEPVDPNTLDENGNPMPGGGGDPNAQPGSLPGEVQAEVQPGGDMVDPEQLDAGGGISDELGAPVDPAMLGPDGQPLPQAGQQQMTAPDGTPLDPQGQQQPMLGPDGMPVGPQELPASAISGDGKPFNPGPNMPEGPGEPDGPQGPEDLDEDGQPLNPDAGQGAPGTPEDGVPDLMCPDCGFTADATQPVSIDMDTANIPSTGEAGPDGVQAGDICPNCGQGLLMTATEMQGQAPVPSPM
jgi:hypothetical protein